MGWFNHQLEYLMGEIMINFDDSVFVTKQWPGELVPELTGNSMGHNQAAALRHKTTWGGHVCLLKWHNRLVIVYFLPR